VSILSQEDARARLGQLPGWQLAGDRIRRVYRFDGFPGAMAFVNRVAEIAEMLDHHPDILIEYDKVTLTSWSHDVRGLTARDFRLAARIDA
jgi:4a-hydroxytetrahydrobiopterin dehydratase